MHFNTLLCRRIARITIYTMDSADRNAVAFSKYMYLEYCSLIQFFSSANRSKFLAHSGEFSRWEFASLIDFYFIIYMQRNMYLNFKRELLKIYVNKIFKN